MFDTMIRLILTYGSDVWDLGKTGIDVVDKVFLNFARCTLSVKFTTCNAIVYGECGRYPLSVFLSYQCLNYVIHIDFLPCRVRKLSKSVFHTLNALQGFSIWVTKAYDLAQVYDIDMNASVALNSNHCVRNERNMYLCKIDTLTSMINYRLYKNEFRSECYLDYINVPKFRIPLSKIRASSHDLEIERGR